MGSDVHLTFERLDLDPINVLPTDRNKPDASESDNHVFNRF
jgi:hypothetical protein